MLTTYFDHNATTPVDDQVAQLMAAETQMTYGNPSSIHNIGVLARKKVEQVRSDIAQWLGAGEDEIFFTSGGSESNNWVIKGWVEQFRQESIHVITSSIEHPAVLEVCRHLQRQGRAEVTYLPVDRHGFFSPLDLERAIRPNTKLISLMLANNEIGTIQPIRECAEVAKKVGVFFHTDAVQAVGKLSVNVNDLGVDALSFSGHKFYGPKGVGGLYLRKPHCLEPLIHGGSQEQGLRSGTENLISIIGMGAAFNKFHRLLDHERERLQALKSLLMDQLTTRIPHVSMNGSVDRERTLCNTVNVCFGNVRGEAVSGLLSQMYGISVSIGSACSSNKKTVLSHVLQAIGLTETEIRSSIRISLGKDTRREDILHLVEALVKVVTQLRSMLPADEAELCQV